MLNYPKVWYTHMHVHVRACMHNTGIERLQEDWERGRGEEKKKKTPTKDELILQTITYEDVNCYANTSYCKQSYICRKLEWVQTPRFHYHN